MEDSAKHSSQGRAPDLAFGSHACRLESICLGVLAYCFRGMKNLVWSSFRPGEQWGSSNQEDREGLMFALASEQEGEAEMSFLGHL